MKRIFFGLAAIVFALGSLAAENDLMGVYEGFWKTPDGKKGRVSAQVRPIGKGNYDGFVAFYKEGAIEAAMRLKQGEAGKFTGTSIKSGGGALMVAVDGTCQIADGKLSGSFKGELGEGSLEGTRSHAKPPSLGAKAPKKGVVLFDGKKAEGWSDFHWKITPEGSMVVGGGDIHAKEKYTNYRLHVEFKTPLMAEATGQGRGNSGVYLQNKYEIQVLDSFGLFPLQNNDCASVYSVRAPDSNVCLPPGEWQTYDITFVQGHAQRGKMPTITVVQNGSTVIDKFELTKDVVEKGTGGAEPEGAFLRLQDHGNPVEYRNIWVEPFFAAEKK